MDLTNKLILELANYSQKYNITPDQSNITEYKIKTQIISSLLENGSVRIPPSNKGSTNISGSCYLNSSLQLLNTIPEIRNIPKYESDENEKINSYLRAVFDELNNDNSKSPINIPSLNVNNNNVLEVFRKILLEPDTVAAGEIGYKSPHEWIMSAISQPKSFVNSIGNPVIMLSIDEDNETNLLRSITLIDEITTYCLNDKDDRKMEEISYEKQFVINIPIKDLSKKKEKICISDLIGDTLLNIEKLDDKTSETLIRCNYIKYESYRKNRYLITPDLTHLILYLEREIKNSSGDPNMNYESIEPDIILNIDGDTFIRQGVIWLQHPFHVKYYLFTDDGQNLYKQYNDSYVTTYSINSTESLKAERKEMIDEIYTKGLIYLYRRITFNTQRNIILTSKEIIEVKNKVITKLNDILTISSLPEDVRNFIELDFLQYESNYRKYERIISLSNEELIQILNLYILEPTIQSRLREKITDQDAILQPLLYAKIKVGKMKKSSSKYFLIYILLYKNSNIVESNKRLIIDKLLDETYINTFDLNKSNTAKNKEAQLMIQNYNNVIDFLEGNISSLTDKIINDKSISVTDSMNEIIKKIIS